MTEREIYLDWAATAPLCHEAASAMEPYFVPGLENLAYAANANSLHSYGRAAFAALENAREQLAKTLGAGRPDEVIFTSGATESNNAALLGIAEARRQKLIQAGKGGLTPHVVTTEIEHDAILANIRHLKRLGFAVTYLKPDRQGSITPGQLADVLTEETVLVTIQAANSEVGTVQPIPELARVAHAQGASFHTDAVQAIGKIPVNLREWCVDAASLSAHKVCGPKGIGALYLRTGTPFEPLIRGGGQERGSRSGTQNVAAAVGFAAACEAVCAIQPSEAPRLKGLRDYLYAELAVLPGVTPSVDTSAEGASHLPNIVNVCVAGFESETLVLRLDRRGFAVSGGSACATHTLEPSHVLRALGIQDDVALGALRLSLGRYTTNADIEAFVEAFKACISE